jgi:hypothetical protein
MFRVSGSVWWRDICRVDSGSGWLTQATSKKVGKGNKTLFGKMFGLVTNVLQLDFLDSLGSRLSKTYWCAMLEVGSVGCGLGSLIGVGIFSCGRKTFYIN